MTTPAALQQLGTALKSTNLAESLAAAWETLDAAGQYADAITWEPGTDELTALAASQTCDAARAALPLPNTRAASVRASSSDDPEPYVLLLRQACEVLSDLAAHAEMSEEGRAALTGTARQVGYAAEMLATARER